MKRKLPAALLVGALALLVLVARPVSAHDYRYGGHVDRYFSPYGGETDRVYRYPTSPYHYSYDRYDRYRDRDCDDHRFQGSSSLYYDGYRRPYQYRSYDRGWWGR